MLKRLVLFTFACTVLAARVGAEPQAPDWDKICPEDQRSWGLEVRRVGMPLKWMGLKIPARIAPFFIKAELILKQHSKVAIRMQCGFEVAPDGSKLLQVECNDTSLDDV